MTRRLAVGIGMLSLLACDDAVTVPPFAERDVSAAVQTGALGYTMARRADAYEVTFDIAFTNRDARAVRVNNCNGQTTVGLQQQVGDAWVAVWSPIYAQCLSPPIVIAPGATYRTAIPLVSGAPNADFEPRFTAAPRSGVDRLVWGSLSYDGAASEPVPDTDRISNRFTISVR